MKEKKQTAVEWLLTFIEPSLTAEQKHFFSSVIEQAKAMEKEQMRLADKNGQDRNQYKHDCEYGGVEYWDNEPKPFDEYYNETFNKTEK